MRVHVAPYPAHLSRAMHRVSAALAKYKPAWVDIVTERERADLEIIHVISLEHSDYALASGRRFATIQYCFKTAGPAEMIEQWRRMWDASAAVWSYYDLSLFHVPRFYHSPLGIDEPFRWRAPADVVQTDRWQVVTTGYVNGPGAEAIEPFALAAEQMNLTTAHLGPEPVGMTVFPKSWRSIHDVSDGVLTSDYGLAAFVSGLRHVEGFELPVVEGLSCGARPIVFDRPETRKWFDGLVEFIDETDDYELLRTRIIAAMRRSTPVTIPEIERARERFEWGRIARGFWARIEEGL